METMGKCVHHGVEITDSISAFFSYDRCKKVEIFLQFFY